MYTKGKLLYENPLQSQDDVKDFIIEGTPKISFPNGRLRMENGVERDMDKGIHANFLFWCLEDFPSDIVATWHFRPYTDAGLAMFWLAAKGRKGEDIMDPALPKRDGNYPQYFNGAINAFHVSYFRRNPTEIVFQTCNLRKSHGFHLVQQGGDPLPNCDNADRMYKVEVAKIKNRILFSMEDIQLFEFIDDGKTYGPLLEDGKIGFRQMAGLVAEYENLTVHEALEK